MSACVACALVLALGWTPFGGADPVPRGAVMLRADGGLALLRVGLPVLPVAPLPTADVELAYGLARDLDLRVHYTTHAGVVHRLGIELRARLFAAPRVAVGVRLRPSARIAGSFATEEGTDYAGDLSTTAALLVTYRDRRMALTLDGGFTAEWLAFQSLREGARVDASPFPAYIEAALEAEWPRGPRSSLVLRLELAGSLVPDDPFAPGGLYPRISFGGAFGL